MDLFFRPGVEGAANAYSIVWFYVIIFLSTGIHKHYLVFSKVLLVYYKQGICT